ncbi:MAG: glycosyltransferase family 4 protein [Planctomycetes bacterium]|nr:glycosyltransferase family 4 protein [Planctomycetota bacterium]
MALKIAIFSRYPSDSRCPKGGVESVTVVLVKALAQLDDLDVHIITLEQKRTKISVEQDGDVTVHKLPGSRWPQILDIFVGPGKKQLVSYIKDLKPDILHTHETYGLGLGTFSIPHVFTVHGFDHANIIADSAKFGWLRSKLWKRMERRGLAAQKHIISITPYVRKMIEPLTGANIYDIDNPVDERFFNIKHQPEPGRILCVGWISERKNTLGAVEAFAAVTGRYAQAQLVIAGEPKEAEYYNRVKRCIDNNRLGNRVELLGHINHTQLEQELARTSVFFLPSRQENSPMAIAEAMATGIPIIASNRCGMPYMISEGKTGFLIDPESTDQITQRLIQLVGSQQLCQQIGLAGRHMALERFHPNAVALRTKAVYEKICTSH